MLSTFIFIAGILITILFVIGVHEYAHFIMARWLGIKVLRFSLGFGKALFRFHDKQGTEFVFALIPLGGYVKMLDEREAPVADHEKHLAFNHQPFYKKTLVVLAGPCSNFLAAILLYCLVFMIGFSTIKPIIGSVSPNSIAARAHLAASQEIVEVDNHPALSWTSVVMRALTHLGDQDPLKIVTKNKDRYQTHFLDLSNWQLNALKPDPLISLGIVPFGAHLKPDQAFPKILLHQIKYSPLLALKRGFQETIYFTQFNLIFFAKLLTGKMSLHSLGGPITIFETAGVALNTGIVPFLAFLAFFSASIGIMNLFPIPGLDGFHLFSQTIEWIIQRPLPERLIILLSHLGFIFLIFILIQAFTNDLLRLL